MITPAEAVEMKTEIELLKRSTKDTLEAIHAQSVANSTLLESVNNLTLEIRVDREKRESHEEKQEIKDSYVQKQLLDNTKRLDYFTENYKQNLDRLKRSQSRTDVFINSIFSRVGITTLAIFFILVLYFFGVNPKDFKL